MKGMTIMSKKRIITIIIALRVLITVCYAINTDDAPYLISGWEGPYEEGVTWFATEDLSIHGGFDPELELILDGVTQFPNVGFQIVNSADKAVMLEKFNIDVLIYHADDVGGTPVYIFDIPAIEGTLPAHSFYGYNAAVWYGRDRSGKNLPDGEYVLQTKFPNQFSFRIEGDNTLITHDVDYRWPGNKSFTIKAEWPKTLTAYIGVGLYLRGEQIILDTVSGDIVCIDGRIYVPLRAVGELLGTYVSWDDKEHTAYIDSRSVDFAETVAIPKEPTKNILTPSKIIAYRNLQVCVNHTFFLEEHVEDGDGYPLIISNRIYIPLRSLSRILNVPIQWDQQTKSVFIGGY
jgi:hypothetical protein